MKKVKKQETLNYSMKYSVSEVAQILHVDKELIKTWAYTFSEYLSSSANPAKGKSREFTVEDIRVFACVSMDWEDEPDIEAIKCGLNSGYQYEDIFNDLIQEVIPIFRDIPEDIDESYRSGAVFGGLAEFGDRFFLADSYRRAGDLLVDAAIANEENYELICPIIFNYRHAAELYLKAITDNSKRTHKLDVLLQKFKTMLSTEFNTTLPNWFENIILAFNDFDPGGTTFRYGGILRDEVFIDLKHLKQAMEWFVLSIRRVREHRSKVL